LRAFRKFIDKIQVSFKSDKNKDKVKAKFCLEQAMKAQRGSRGIALLFL
jgi:hypothetical protein